MVILLKKMLIKNDDIKNNNSNNIINNNSSNYDKLFFAPFDIFSKLRMYSQHCIAIGLKKKGNSFYDLWLKLLPSNKSDIISQKPFYGNNLFTVLLYDPHPRVRNAAAMSITNILETCPLSNLMMSVNNKTNTFTTISDQAKNTLKSMHIGLTYALLEREVHLTPRIQILKCLLKLVKITDYNKMKYGLLIPIIKMILQELNNSNGLYRNTLINLLSTIYSIKYNIKELNIFFYQNNNENILIMPILLQEIKKSTNEDINEKKNDNNNNNNNNNISPSIKNINPIIILISMAKHYRKHICKWWSKGIRDVISTGFKSFNYSIILNILKLIQNWIVFVKQSDGVDNNDSIKGNI